MGDRPLAAAEVYPAHAAGVSSRTIALSTGIRMRIAECGPPNGVPVVMLHGWGASLYTFRHALERFPSRGFRVVAADQRGFGLTDRPTAARAYEIGAYEGDVDALFDALELERAALVGHSMGGGLSLRYALLRPERVISLALINPTELVPVNAFVPVRMIPLWLANAVGEGVITRGLTKFILEHIAFDDASRVSERDVDEYWAPTQIPGYMRAVRRTASEFDWRPLSDAEASALSVPATVVLGTRDRLVPKAKRAALRLRGASVHEVQGGHCVHEERPDEVYEIIADALAAAARGGEAGRII